MPRVLKIARKTAVRAITPHDLRKAGAQLALSWMSDSAAAKCFMVSIEIGYDYPENCWELMQKAFCELTHGEPIPDEVWSTCPFENGIRAAMEKILANLKNEMCGKEPDVSDYLHNCIDIDAEQIALDLAKPKPAKRRGKVAKAA